MIKLLLTTILMFMTMEMFAQSDSIPRLDSIQTPPAPKMSFWEKAYEVVKEFSRVDSNYIEDQRFNYTVMLQNTNTYESYWFKDEKGYSIRLTPKLSTKFGPYVGWRWIVLGYTIDFSHLSDGKNKQDFDFSIYSNQVGIDIHYRKTGNNYKIRSLYLGEDVNTDVMEDLEFDGFEASIKGLNVYYIFNHKKFSYPAAFSQSTCQRKSAGSYLMGFSYTRHNINLDAKRLMTLINERMGLEAPPEDQMLQSATVNYTDISISAGYAYNWVFARDWLFGVSLSLALGNKRSVGEKEYKRFSFRDFSFNSLNIDGIGRFGIVWNNTKYYAGMSAILHTYNYSKSQFSTNSTFGNLNIYFGFNFGNRHRTHKKKK
ncbi:MAG: DUF4421 domain-containing protein [Prevotella sp.]|nr:DUF4421 domain-containing protein [Prevotella sp.]